MQLNRIQSQANGKLKTLATEQKPLVVKVTIARPSIKNASAQALSMLSAAEVRDLVTCEEVIAKGWDTFLEVGRALAQIRDKRLYRADFDTFDAYCRKKWNYGKSQAYRLIGAAEVLQHLSPIGDIPMPRSESHVRPLLGLKPEQVKTVWCEVVRKAGKQSVTARLVKQMADQLRESPKQRATAGNITPNIEVSLERAEELLKKARQALKSGDRHGAVAFLNRLGQSLRSGSLRV